MKVSVVIPAYNAEPFIARTVQSVLDQTFRDFEIVVIDDGSSDATREIVTAMGGPVKLVARSRLGVSKARNEGVRLARGEYVAFLDHDDLWEPDKIRRQVEILDSDPKTALVFTQARVEEGSLLREIYPAIPDPAEFFANAYENLVHWNYIPMSSVLVRREGLPEFDARFQLSEDWDLWLRVASKGGPGSVAFLAEPLTRYQIVQGRATSRMADLRLEDIAIFREQIRSNPWLTTKDPARCRQTLHRFCEEAGYWLFKEGRGKEARKLLREAWRLKPASLKPLKYFVASLLYGSSSDPARA